MKEDEQRKTSRWFLAGIVLLMAAVFGAGLVIPLGIAQGVLYVAPVALSMWKPGRHYTLPIAAACAVLVVLGVFLAPHGSGPVTYAIINRSYSLFAIGMIVLIDRLHRQLARRNEELVFRTTSLEALYEIGNALTALHDVGMVEEAAVSRACQLLAGDSAGLALVNEDSGEISWQLLTGAARDQLKSMRLQLGEGLVGKAIQSGEPVVIEDALLHTEGNATMDAPPAGSNLQTALIVPLGVGGKPVGALMVGYLSRHYFPINEVKLLLGLADQVAIAINNAHLYERLRALSALEERQRLAREMHDGLAQLLGNITAQATASGELLAQGRWEDARQRLARLREVAEMAYGEVRQSILGLRATLPETHDFLKALNQFVVRINREEGLLVHVESRNPVEIGLLTPAVEFQAISIIQEALRNVRKHSQANEAFVKLHKDAGWLFIAIQDNGRGFDLGEARGAGSHFGLQIMSERAESVGGHLDIETTLGGGTSVMVRLPVSEEEVHNAHKVGSGG